MSVATSTLLGAGKKECIDIGGNISFLCSVCIKEMFHSMYAFTSRLKNPKTFTIIFSFMEVLFREDI